MYKIGVFIGNIDEQYQKLVWKGILDEAYDKKVNILCFPGLRVNHKDNFEYQANIVYKLAGKSNIDGLIILSNTIFYNLKKNEILKFCANYKNIPVLNFGFFIPGFTSIKVDSNYGIKELVSHLVKVHGYKKFAFVKGPQNHPEAQNRFKVFCNALAKYKISIDDDLIVNGDFLKESGYQAVETLLDKRKKKFNVIAAANDTMAIGAIESLQNRNIIVPDDIAVVGYDDTEVCHSCTPRLTTVHQPIYEKGREAISTILKIIKEGKIKKTKVVPSSLIIRQSCGCFSNIEGINADIILKDDNFFSNFKNLKNIIIEECRAPIGLTKKNFKHTIEEKWIIDLFETYYNNVKNIESDDFINKLDDILKTLLYSNIDVYFWHNLISTFRRHTLKFSLDRYILLKAESIWEQARIIIDDRYNRSESIKKIQKESLTKNIWEIGNYISSVFYKEKLVDEIIECLKRFKIELCFFSIYENNNSMNLYPEKSRLILAVINGKKADIGENGIVYKSEYLIPKKLFPKKTRFPLIIKPLYFRKEQLGFIILEMKLHDPLIYDILRQYISSALKGSFLMNEVKEHANILEDEVKKRTEDLVNSNIKLNEEIKQRKIIEIALKENEINLKAITEAIPIPLLIAHLPDGNILYTNHIFNIRFGINNINKINIFDLCVDHDRIDEIIKQLIKDENISDIELNVYHFDKSIFWVLASFQRLIFKEKKCFIAGFYDITKRKHLEKEILDISDREQTRIGQDLHDDLCQRLAGIAAMITAFENNIKKDNIDEKNKVSQISQFLNDSIIQTKKLARGLYPIILEENGLIYSIEELANKVRLQFEKSCEFVYNNDILIKDKSISLHLYRITQEAVYNSIKHAESNKILIRLVKDANTIKLSIKDDGKGFIVDEENYNGMGLKIMNYRSNIIGGKFNVKSNKFGTVISCTININDLNN